MKLSIIIPAYNEEERLGRMLDDYVPFFSNLYGDDCELIVVVNGSRDGTASVACGYADRYPSVRVVEEPASVGKGGAVMIGFRLARGAKIGFVDADGATPPAAFQALVENIGDAGAIIASRWIRGADVRPRQPWSRRVASRVFNCLVRVLFKLKISDTQCGAKLMTSEAVRSVLPRLGVTRWAFDVDLLFKLRRDGFSIMEIPSTWHDVSGSRVKIVRASAEMIAALTRLRLLYSPFSWIVMIYDLTIGRIVHYWK